MGLGMIAFMIKIMFMFTWYEGTLSSLLQSMLFMVSNREWGISNKSFAFPHKHISYPSFPVKYRFMLGERSNRLNTID